MAASVSEDNVLQIWQMAENIYNDEDDNAEDVDDDDIVVHLALALTPRRPIFQQHVLLVRLCMDNGSILVNI